MSTTPRDMREWMRAVERKLQMAIRSGNSSLISTVRAELGKVQDEIVANAPDARIAARPVELVSSSAIYFNGDGQARGRITLAFAAVTRATNGTFLQIDNYELWGRDETGKTATELETLPFERLKVAETNAVVVTGLNPGSTWRLKVRAMSVTSPLPGEFSVEALVQVGVDTTPPPIPSAAIVSSNLGVGVIEFNGLAANGAEQPTDYSYTEVALGEASSPTTTLPEVFRGAGRMNLPWMAYGTYFIRLRSVDTSGNASSWSANAVLAITPLVTGDISGLDTTLQQQVDRAEAAEDAAEQSAVQAVESLQAAEAAQAAAVAAQGNADASQQAALNSAAEAAAAQAVADAAQAAADQSAAEAAASQAAATQAQADAQQALLDLQAGLGAAGKIIRQETAPTGEDQSENNLWIKDSTGESFTWDPVDNAWELVENQSYAAAAQQADAAADRAEAAEAAALQAEADAVTARNDATAAQTAAQTSAGQATTAQQAATAAETRATNAETRATAAEAAAQTAKNSADAALADLQAALGESAQIVRQEAAPTGDLQRAGVLWIKDSTGESFTWDGDSWEAVDNQVIAGMALAADQAADRAEASAAEATVAKNQATTAKNDATTAKNQATTAQSAATTAQQAATAAEGRATAAEGRAATAEAAATAAESSAQQAMDDLATYLGSAGKVIYQEAMPTGDDRNPNNLWLKPSDGTAWAWDNTLATPAWVKVTDQRIIDAALSADQAADAAVAAQAQATTAKNEATTAKNQATTAQNAASASAGQASASATAANQAQAEADAAAQDAAAAAQDAADSLAAANAAAQAAGSSSAEATLAKVAAEAAQEIADEAKTTADAATVTAEKAIADAEAAAGAAGLKGQVWVQDEQPAGGVSYGWVGSSWTGTSAAVQTRDGVIERTNHRTTGLHRFAAGMNIETRGGSDVPDAAISRYWRTNAKATTEPVTGRGFDLIGNPDLTATPPQALAVTPGQPVTISFWARTTLTSATVILRLATYNAAGARTTNTAPLDVATPANVWRRYSYTFTPATGQAFIAAYASAARGGLWPTTDDYFDLAGLMVEYGSTTGAYFDGDTADERAFDLWIDTANGNLPRRRKGTGKAIAAHVGGGAGIGNRIAVYGWETTVVTSTGSIGDVSQHDLIVFDAGYAGLNNTDHGPVIRAALAAGVNVLTSGNDTTGLLPLFVTAQRGTDTSQPINPVGNHPAAKGWAPDIDTDMKLYLTSLDPLAVVTGDMLAQTGNREPVFVVYEDPTTKARWAHLQTYQPPDDIVKAHVDWLADAWIAVTDAGIKAAADAAGDAQSAADAAQEAADDAAAAATAASGKAGDAQDTADAALNAATHAGKNLFSPDVPSGSAPYGTVWTRHDAQGKAIGAWQQTGGSAPNPVTGLGGTDGSTWTARPVTSEMIDNLDVTKLTGLYIDAKHIQTSTLTIGGTTLGNKVANLDATGKLPTAQLSGTVSNTQIATGLDPSKLTGAGTIPESKVPTLTEAKIPTLSQSKVVGLSTIASEASAAKAKTDAAIGADNKVLDAAIPTLSQSKINGLVTDLSTMNAATAAAQKAAIDAMAGAVNVIPDPSFEDGRWAQAPRITEDTTVKRSGGKSLKITGQAGSSTINVLNQHKVQAGQVWRFTLWYKTTADYNGTSGWGKFRLGRDASATGISNPVFSANKTDWTQVEINYTCPEGIETLTLQICFDHTAGTMWIDDVAAQDITAAQVAADAAQAAANQANAAMLASAYSRNPSFDDWSGTIPDVYATWSGAPPTKDLVNKRIGPHGLNFNVATSAEQRGMSLGGVAFHMPYQQYVTVEVDFMLHSGGLAGAGVLVDWGSRTPNRVTIKLSDAVPSPTLGRWYRLAFTIAETPGAVGTFSTMSGFLMANYSPIGSAAKSITFDWFNLRPATLAEIDGLLGKQRAYSVTDGSGNLLGSKVTGAIPVASVPTIPQNKVENLPSAVLALNAIEARQDQWTFTGTTFIDGGEIYTDSITTLQLKANAVTTEIIAAGAIGASEIDVDALWADAAWLEVIKSSSLTLENTVGEYTTKVGPNGVSVERKVLQSDGSFALFPSVQYGAFGDNRFATYDGDGAVLGSFDKDGGLTATSSFLTEDPTIGGRSLLGDLVDYQHPTDPENVDGSWLSSMPRGMGAYGYRDMEGITSSAYVERSVFEVAFEVLPYRAYLINIEPFHVTANNASGTFGSRMRFTDDGSAPTVQGAQAYRWKGASNPSSVNTIYDIGSWSFMMGSSTGERFTRRMLFTVFNGGPISVVGSSGWGRYRVTVFDMGSGIPERSVVRTSYGVAISGGAQGSTDAPAAVKPYWSVWNADWYQSYYGASGAKQVSGHGASMLKQGRDPYWTAGGQQTSIVGFNTTTVAKSSSAGETNKTKASALSGADLRKARLRIHGAYDPTGSSGTVRVHWHTTGSIPATLADGSIANHLGDYAISNGGSREIVLPPAVKSAISSGSFRGFTFAARGNTGTEYALGISWAKRPELILNYDR